jgi:hypothetical protein
LGERKKEKRKKKKEKIIVGGTRSVSMLHALPEEKSHAFNIIKSHGTNYMVIYT